MKNIQHDQLLPFFPSFFYCTDDLKASSYMLYVKDEGLGGVSGYTGGSLGMFSQFIPTSKIHSITASNHSLLSP